MLPKVIQDLRFRMLERGWWPVGRLARVTAYFGALFLLLLILSQVGALFTIGWLSGLSGLAKFLGYVAAIGVAILIFRWVRRKLMWRLRNRLIVTYVFIGVIPVVLLICMGLISAYGLAGQFAIFAGTSDLQSEVQSLSFVNGRLAADLAARLREGANGSALLLRGALGPSKLLQSGEITAWYRGASMLTKTEGQPIPLPAAALGENFDGLALDRGHLVLRSVDTETIGPNKLTVIASIPVDNTLLEHVAESLGEVRISSIATTRTSKGRTDTFDINVDDAPSKKEGKPKTSGSTPPATSSEEFGGLRAGSLPPAKTRLDREITAPSTISMRDWQTGESRQALLVITTRPSLLYGRLFKRVGEFAAVVVGALEAVAVFFAVIELVALIIGWRLTRTITRSVAELYRATQNVNRGDLRHRIKVTRQDQLAALEGSFNSMTESLERLLVEQKEAQRLQNELVIAQEVQEQLFPRKISELEGLEVHGVCRPARTVSGDYYDFLPLGAERMAIAVGDVSGKGISAALLMATINSAVRAYILETSPILAAAGGHRGNSVSVMNGHGLSPSAVFYLLNRQLYRSTPMEKYATLFLGTYEAQSRVLRFANGGHLPPIILHRDGTIRRLEPGGTVLGLFDELSWQEDEVQLAAGDVFIAYSDGITEPENDFGEFGEHRLLELVRKNRTLPLARISEAVTSAVTDWIGGAEQPDDITLVLARAR